MLVSELSSIVKGDSLSPEVLEGRRALHHVLVGSDGRWRIQGWFALLDKLDASLSKGYKTLGHLERWYRDLIHFFLCVCGFRVGS